MWKTAQEHEAKWWGNCANTLGEELKQTVYAKKMMIDFVEQNGVPFVIDLHGKRILDIGGGPCSLLLKTVNSPMRVVLDPCNYPNWVKDRYTAAGIFYGKDAGENIPYDFDKQFDEVWIYNVLQHVEDPEKVIQNAKRVGKLIRLFEWIDAEKNEMHPHTLTEENLDKWLLFPPDVVSDKTQMKAVKQLSEAGCFGKAYYGIF